MNLSQPITSPVEALHKSVSVPFERARAMPPEVYTSNEFAQAELDHIFKKDWFCIGRATSLANAGDYVICELADQPDVVLRDANLALKAYSNVCLHRMSTLLEGRGSTKSIVCPYHAWTYNFDGSLRGAPAMEGNAGFSKSDYTLPEVACQEWLGWVFISLNPNAKPVADQLAQVETLIAGYDMTNYTETFFEAHVWDTNWKVLVENFMEGYHLSVVHPDTLHSYTPTGLARKLVGGDGFTSYAANYPKDIPSRGLVAPGLSDDERLRSTLFSLFPTQVASQAASLLVSLSLFPLNAGQLRVKWTLSTYGDDLDDATIVDRIALWEEVNAEDREKLERLQIALASDHALSGPLAGDDYEGTIRDFHLWLAAQDRKTNAPERSIDDGPYPHTDLQHTGYIPRAKP